MCALSDFLMCKYIISVEKQNLLNKDLSCQLLVLNDLGDIVAFKEETFLNELNYKNACMWDLPDIFTFDKELVKVKPLVMNYFELDNKEDYTAYKCWKHIYYSRIWDQETSETIFNFNELPNNNFVKMKLYAEAKSVFFIKEYLKTLIKNRE